MWIELCLERFALESESYTGRRQDLSTVEREFSEAISQNLLGAPQLEIIEKSSAWTYPSWWPRLSSSLDAPVAIPSDLRPPETKRRLVEALQAKLKHIEVVSVVLRFLCPEEFGILSPPVTTLLSLAPAERHGHVPHYCRYLRVLHDLRDHYGMDRVADVDMALWAAAHLSSEAAGLADEMYADEYFVEKRLTNLLEGLGRRWRHTDAERLALARVLLKQDHIVAALIAARCFEDVVRVIAAQMGVDAGAGKSGQTELSNLVDALSRRKAELAQFGVSPGELRELRGLRNDAVHSLIEKQGAKKLVDWTSRLHRALGEAASLKRGRHPARRSE